MSTNPESILSRFLNTKYKVRPLPGEHDANFHVEADDGCEYLLKISKTSEVQSIVEMQNAALQLLADHPNLQTPTLVPTLSGEYLCDCDGKLTRLFKFLPGTLFANVKYHSSLLLNSLGEKLAHLTQKMSEFRHENAKRYQTWDLQQAEWKKEHLDDIADANDRQLLTTIIENARPALSKLPQLRQSIIHGDVNDYNILVTQHEVSGFIDFGDMVETATICELAIALAYAMLNKPDPLQAAVHVIQAYIAVYPLLEEEIDVLFDLICLRLALSVITSAQRKKLQPDDEYLTISEKPAWDLLRKLYDVHPRYARYIFRDAAGFEPCADTSAIIASLEIAEVGPLFEFDLASVSKTFLNLSVRNVMQKAIDPQKIAIGLYNEARLCYSNDQYTQQTNDGSEQRTIHLGLDIFVVPRTPVLAPLTGMVHSFADNNDAQDYGPTVILKHTLENVSFYTLYGHLSRETLATLQVGKKIQKGEVLGWVGDEKVNGGWPPHLHFQIITDIFAYLGNYPGVSAVSKKNVWLSLCPDPNLITKIPKQQFPTQAWDKNHIALVRRQHTAKNLKCSYAEPIEIVRGIGQYLYDENGRQYLDCVNNVCHVGHCQADVVQAAMTQMQLLNTNTRYLHENLTRYAQALSAKLPMPLEVCFFVNSGSEANELALRLAQAHTKRKNILVLDHGYHGNTSALINISPYKFNGAGGAGKPEYVEIIPIPTAADFKITEIKADTAAFICEALPSCAGQIVLPKNFLKTIYQSVRANGGVCIADEVQIGLGRVGTHFWGFETQEVIPDIVTIGKPLGNGHPLAAVVTTREIADSFANGMEYFNTFGGNPVSCAIGLAVLEVIERDQLQAHALAVGTELKQKLNRLKEKYTCITDVRGLGLFLGVEIKNKEIAGLLVNGLKQRGILLSTDGPQENVIKFKPPMVFTSKDGEFLINNFDVVLSSVIEM